MKKIILLIISFILVLSLWGCNSITTSPKEKISKILNWQSLEKAKNCQFSWSWRNLKMKCKDPFTFLLYKDISSSTWDIVAKKDLENDLASTKSFVGIWISITNTDKGILVDDIFTNNWLLRWDYILKVNWKKVKTLFQTVKLIKWPVWTKVKLTVKRNWKILSIVSERKKIKLKQYKSKIINFKDNQFGYLKINNISNEIYSQIKPVLAWFKAVGCKGIILDLRDNWWGYMNEAININKLWANKWNIVLKVKELDEYWKINNHSFVATKKWLLNWFPTVILVNWNTASAAEIITAGIKENNIWTTKLVWTKTFWKWTIQTIQEINKNFDLKYTIWKWYTPSWRNLSDGLKPWNGLEPDVKIEFNEKQYKKNLTDNQLEKAKEVLNELIK